MPPMLSADAMGVHYLQVQRGGLDMPLPGTSIKTVDFDDFGELPTGEAGMIMISGPQVMQGYLNDPQRTAQALRDIDDQYWYVAGAKGFIDEDGFLTLIDRYVRFAKIGGEMISAVEAAVKAALGEPDNVLMAMSIPDNRKGERIVLLSETALDANTVQAAMLANSKPAMMIPSHWLTVETIPHLGSGKADFAGAKRLAQELIGEELTK